MIEVSPRGLDPVISTGYPLAPEAFDPRPEVDRFPALNPGVPPDVAERVQAFRRDQVAHGIRPPQPGRLGFTAVVGGSALLPHLNPLRKRQVD
jgi:hypothetical protein